MMRQQDNLSTEKIVSQTKRNPAKPCILIIFGATGDLTKRLLFPALCNLASNGLLDKSFCIIGIAKSDYNDETFRAKLTKNVNEFFTDSSTKKFYSSLINRIHYISGDFSDLNVYSLLKNKLAELSAEKASKNYLFYFATSPEFIETIANGLSKVSLLSEDEDHYFRRIIVEKPFGHDLASSKKLNKILLSLANEKQIFHIDHFLGKETIQNLVALRFLNSFFEPIWNRLYIDHVQITVAETSGVELRGNYYEHTGALRDMVPNHLFQVLSLIAMEPPSSFSSDHIQEEKIKVLHTIRTPTPEQVVSQVIRGQYGPGKIDNVKVVAYRSEPRVAPQSSTETYVALKLFLDSWRWLQVPFYLRTGKRMLTNKSEIIIQFKSELSTLFNGSKQKTMPNLLHISIQPEESISLRFNAKIPGPDLQLDQVEMKFKYSDYFDIKPKTGYEILLYDCMNGNHLLFQQAKMIEAGWALVQPILDVWSTSIPHDFPNYTAGTCGPKKADELLQQDGRKWLL